MGITKQHLSGPSDFLNIGDYIFLRGGLVVNIIERFGSPPPFIYWIMWFAWGDNLFICFITIEFVRPLAFKLCLGFM